ncbi:reprolysin-like metallopeptidase [uncultured Aquimarina sp.]|uniref:zinc-dependent metalloprotease n=1 Tax=uncultured Aquimarina sp. TaxID=575652 RepID=UPI002604AC85|nr:M12 family metallo-peptidase [uncultured Aquimarina sp.]
MRKNNTRQINFCFLFFAFILCYSGVHGQKRVWSETKPNAKNTNVSLKNLDVAHFKVFDLNYEDFKDQLQTAPLRGTSVTNSRSIISFPNEQGKISQYKVMETSIFSSKDNTYQHPNIKTYLGWRTDNSGTRARFSVTPQGLKAMISEPGKETVFIQPITKKSKKQYLIYNKSARVGVKENFECLTEDLNTRVKNAPKSIAKDANDQVLRTFRMAVTTTSEYTAFWDDGDASNGDARADALAQVVSTMNRVNEVYESDMAITFVLVDTADDPALDLIYEDPDPYSNNVLVEMQTVIDQTVGAEDYDIGHLFVYNPNGNNGAAGDIGNVCRVGVTGGIGKASGFSAHTFTGDNGGPYMSDYFDVDYVAHEIGHQMGANHTWSFSSEGTGVNVEPGSGTTIMGYAGITAENDVQLHSDAHFHYASINQILNLVSPAGSCAMTTPITNAPPVADAGLDYVIPNGTAFILKASVTDADAGDVHTYTWEQLDDGITTFQTFGPDKTTGAVWRSRPPSISPNRYMPILERVLTGGLTQTNPVLNVENTSWETVSNVARELNFGLTVRDRSESGGFGQTPQSDFDEMKVTVDGTAGPFVVTSQSTEEFWPVSSTKTITWNVAGTDTGAVNVSTVNILLSSDGGLTFPVTLAAAVPNNGSYEITVPDIANTATARIMIEANDNIFYAVNSSNFTVDSASFDIEVNNLTQDVCLPDNGIVYNFSYETFSGFNSTTSFTVNGLPAGATAVINPTSATQGTMGTVTISGLDSVDLGSYAFALEATSGTDKRTVDNLGFRLYPETLSAVTLSSPENNADNVSLTSNLTWSADVSATNYLIEIATDQNFTEIVESGNLDTTSYTTRSLLDATTYFWRVTSSNPCDTGMVSVVNSFTTVACYTFNSVQNDITIPDTGTANHVITSTITVAEDITISDLNISVNILHDYVEDIELRLISPEGSEIVLLGGVCGAGDNMAVTFDDEADGSLECSASAPAVEGIIIPANPLSTFQNESALGDWVLQITDVFPSADGGEFQNFSLQICGQESTTLSINDLSEEVSLIISPNPSEGNVLVTMDVLNNDDINIDLYDLRGRLISTQSFNNPGNTFKEELQFIDLAPAIYILSIENGGQRISKQLVIK